MLKQKEHSFRQKNNNFACAFHYFFDVIFLIILGPGLSCSVGEVVHAGGMQREPATNSYTKAVN